MIKLFLQSIGCTSRTRIINLIRTSLIFGMMLGLVASLGHTRGQAAVLEDPFVILLKGIYEPAVHGPNLGLKQVDLSDSSYIKTKIYRVSGLPGGTDTDQAVGNFYVQFPTGNLCAYELPGGAFTMVFTGEDVILVDDNEGGMFMIGTFELTILEATGIYKSFVGGHNQMVDVLHFLADGNLDEYCFCHINRP